MKFVRINGSRRALIVNNSCDGFPRESQNSYTSFIGQAFLVTDQRDASYFRKNGSYKEVPNDAPVGTQRKTDLEIRKENEALQVAIKRKYGGVKNNAIRK